MTSCLSYLLLFCCVRYPQLIALPFSPKLQITLIQPRQMHEELLRKACLVRNWPVQRLAELYHTALQKEN